MRDLVFVGLGGFVGSVSRYALGLAVARVHGAGGFPLGTLIVNAAGCLVLGLVLGAAESRGAPSAASRAFVVVGLLGGFTTFSAFGGETFQLLRAGAWGAAALSAALQLAIGVGAVAAGFALIRR